MTEEYRDCKFTHDLYNEILRTGAVFAAVSIDLQFYTAIPAKGFPGPSGALRSFKAIKIGTNGSLCAISYQSSILAICLCSAVSEI